VSFLEVVAEGSHVRALTDAKVIGPVTGTLVVVGEDDQLGRVEVELLLLDPLVVERLTQATGDATLKAVELFGRDIAP
jgi:hypothetical protein